MRNVPYETAASVHVIEGRVGTGKTEHLVQYAAALLRDGVPPAEIVVFVAGDTASVAFEERLRSACGLDGELPRVTTAFEYELDVLATSRASERTGRYPRVLLPFEEAMLMEDMKTSMVEPKRLREMVKFFYRSMSELEPMDHDWFYSDEEERTYELLQSLLALYGAYLESEVGRYAFTVLGESDMPGMPFVLVDDYQFLSKASQCCMANLATEELWIAFDEHARAATIERYVYGNGAHELVCANAECEQVQLLEGCGSHGVVSAVNALLGDEMVGLSDISERPGTDEGNVQVISYRRCKDEFEGIADIVERALARGCALTDIAVASPRPIWEANVVRALKRRGIAVARPLHLRVGFDVHDVDGNIDARIVTLLQLIANPDDSAALRCWCGFGDYLVNSSIISRCAQLELPFSLGHAPDVVPADETLLAQERERIADALKRARVVLGGAVGLAGGALVQYVVEHAGVSGAQEPSAALREILANIPENASAADICETVRAASLHTRFAPYGVRVGGLGDFTGCSFQLVVLSGFVNGLIPQRRYFDPTVLERDRRPGVLSADIKRVCTCAGKARETLFITHCEEALLRDAERLGLKVERIRLIDDERVCELSPSECVRELTGVRFDE